MRYIVGKENIHKFGERSVELQDTETGMSYRLHSRKNGKYYNATPNNDRAETLRFYRIDGDTGHHIDGIDLNDLISGLESGDIKIR